MEHIIDVVVKDKVALCSGARYVCGNSDYVVHFEFDEEWNEFDVKTARFKYGGEHTDVVFSGCVCAVPVITGVELFSVGVYAGNIHTTTPAYVRADKSVLCGDSVPADPAPDVYAQIMDMLNKSHAGADGYSPTVDLSETADGVTITVTNKNGQETAAVKHGKDGATGPAGAKGEKGDKGDKGEPGTVGPQGPKGDTGAKGEKGDTGATGATGPKGDTGTTGPAGADGKTPVKGTDYFTEADKAELVNDVLAALPNWEGGSY